jgi:phage tail-like protein
MADAKPETVLAPFTTFNFVVEIAVDGVGAGKICSAAFAECDGLEMSMQPRTIREGGNNGRQIHLTGPVSYGQLTLKRGMTANLDLWSWFERVHQKGHQGLRADGEVVMLAEDGQTERARFVLTRCLPVKLKAPSLNAKEGAVAIEEMQVVYESLRLKQPSA